MTEAQRNQLKEHCREHGINPMDQAISLEGFLLYRVFNGEKIENFEARLLEETLGIKLVEA
jgi:hypothetical protein